MNAESGSLDTAAESHSQVAYRRFAARDFLAACIAWTAALLVVGTFGLIVGSVAWQGGSRVSWRYLTEPPINAGRAGGIGPILVSTVLILFVCLSVAVPIGFGAAVYLVEFTAVDSRLARSVRRSLDVLAGVPSIVFGLFGLAFFSVFLRMGFSILSGGLTLTCMVLPLLVRTVEDGLEAAAREHRAAAAALGLSKTATLFRLLLPAAMPTLIVGLVLSLGRAIAETAALIFTSGYVTRMPESLLDSGRALSVHIFDLAMNISGGDQAANASALVLVVLVALINGVATGIANRWRRTRWHAM